MRVVDAKFVLSAHTPSQFPTDDLSTDDLKDGPGEIAFAGRSNVGKSSLLNRLMGRRSLVKVSARPGFTQTINFFRVRLKEDNREVKIYLVDLPGYGYARAPKAVIMGWKRLVSDYFSVRSRALSMVVAIFDIRRDPDSLDIELLSFIRSYGLTIIPVFNKCDKLGKSRLAQHAKVIKKALGLSRGPGFLISARTGYGVEELRKRLFEPYFKDNSPL